LPASNFRQLGSWNETEHVPALTAKPGKHDVHVPSERLEVLQRGLAVKHIP
jgi:hypothetical protein